MTRRKLVGLGLVIISAFIATAAVPAAASPVFYTKVEYGETANTPVEFTASLGSAFLEGEVSKNKTECQAGTATGEVSSPTTTTNVQLAMTSCKTAGFSCTTAGEVEGTIKYKTLEGELGDVKKGLTGLRLFDETGGRGAILAEFSCAGGVLPVKAKGSIIGQLTTGGSGPTVSESSFVASFKLTFAQSFGVQQWTAFLGESGSEQIEWKTGEGAYENEGYSVIMTIDPEGVENLGYTE